MKIAIVYQYYQNHNEPGHSLIYELAHYLADKGHEITVVTGEVGYMRRGVAPGRPWYRRLIYREQDGNVSVIRTYTYAQLHRTYMKRLLSFLSFSISCPLAMLFMRRSDVVLASSPPLFPVFSASLVCRLRRIPFVLEVRDLWPAAAVQLGLLHNPLLIGIMSRMERRLYNQALAIITLTEGIKDNICGRGWLAEKVAVITCGIDETFMHPDRDAGNRIRSRHGWNDKKIVLYFGALGIANNIPVILRAAQRLKDRREILFVLIGDGMMRESLVAEVREKNIGNVLILPPVPKKDATSYINAADLCLVTLQDVPLFGGSIPTKLIDYMACGKPVLYGINNDSGHILDQSGCGITFAPDDDEQLGRLILKLTDESETAARMGAQGPAYVRQNFSLASMQERAENVLEETAATAAKAA